MNIMTFINMVCDMPLWEQFLVSLPLIFIAAGIVWLGLFVLYRVAYAVLERVNEALERETYNPEWMDATKWEEV